MKSLFISIVTDREITDRLKQLRVYESSLIYMSRLHTYLCSEYRSVILSKLVEIKDKQDKTSCVTTVKAALKSDTTKYLGAFHSTKITGSNFRNFRWSNETRLTAFQNWRSLAL